MTRPRGSILVVTMWAVIAITGIVLTLSYTMRVEAIASANRLAQSQADAAARGMEQMVLAAVDHEMTTPGSLDQLTLEGRQIGDCTVWVVRPDWEDDQTPACGLSDEQAKLDLNTASRDAMLLVPGMTEDVADAIIDWRDADSQSSAQGAEDDYYLALPEPYRCKNAPLDSVEELLLVKGVTRERLFGYDRNRNGTLDTSEISGANAGAAFSSGNSTGRGIFPFLTVYGAVQPTTRANATRPTNVNNAIDPSALRTLLNNSGLNAARVDQIIEATRNELRSQNGRDPRPFRNLFDFHFRVRLQMEEFTKLYPSLTAGPLVTSATTQPATALSTSARININTAPREVLLTLPGLDDNDVAALISRRQATTEDPSNIAWVAEVLNQQKAVRIGSLITGKSAVYSADIVALSADGRAFRRNRIVVSAATTPARIIYRRDLTNAGWPLPPEIRATVRSGEQYQAPIGINAAGGR